MKADDSAGGCVGRGFGVLVGAKVAVGAGVGELVGAKVTIGVTVGTQVMVGSGSDVGREVTVGTRVMVGAFVGNDVVVGVVVTASGTVVVDSEHADSNRTRVHKNIKILNFLVFIINYPIHNIISFSFLLKHTCFY